MHNKIKMLRYRYSETVRDMESMHSWAPATWKVAPLPLFGKKQRRCRLSLLKKAEPLPLLAYKTEAAAATLEKYLPKRTMAFKYGTL